MRGLRTGTRKTNSPAVSLQCPLLTKLNMISASKTKIFKSPAPLWQNKRVSLELRNMKLIIGTAKVFWLHLSQFSSQSFTSILDKNFAGCTIDIFLNTWRKHRTVVWLSLRSHLKEKKKKSSVNFFFLCLIFTGYFKDSFFAFGVLQIHCLVQFSSVQSLSCVRLFATPWTTAHQVSLSITNSQSLPKLMSIESVIPSNHLILCHPLLLPPSIFPSIRIFSKKLTLLIRWPKYLSFSFNISPSNEYSGLISFRMDWVDLLVDQGTLKSLLQHHSSKASILQCSAFFIVQLSHHIWLLEKP